MVSVVRQYTTTATITPKRYGPILITLYHLREQLASETPVSRWLLFLYLILNILFQEGDVK